jgi:hypothetical protein
LQDRKEVLKDEKIPGGCLNEERRNCEQDEEEELSVAEMVRSRSWT